MKFVLVVSDLKREFLSIDQTMDNGYSLHLTKIHIKYMTI